MQPPLKKDDLYLLNQVQMPAVKKGLFWKLSHKSLYIFKFEAPLVPQLVLISVEGGFNPPAAPVLKCHEASRAAEKLNLHL